MAMANVSQSPIRSHSQQHVSIIMFLKIIEETRADTAVDNNTMCIDRTVTVVILLKCCIMLFIFQRIVPISKIIIYIIKCIITLVIN